MPRHIKIISFNIWDLPLSLDIHRRQRVLRIADYLKKIDADIICLQESWDAEHRRLIHQALGADYFALSSNLKSYRLLRRFSNTRGGLFTLSKFPVIAESFSPFSWLNHSITEMLGNKGVLETIVETPFGPLRILNTHLHAAEGLFGPWLNFGPWVRFRQFKKVLEKAGPDNGVTTILAGDLNEHAIIEQEQLAELLTAAGFNYCSNGSPALTFRETAQCLDYILVRSLNDAVIADYGPEYVTPRLSDHDPVLLTILFP